MKTASVQLVIVGSIGLDTIATPTERVEDVLGGSVSFACVASAFFAKTGLVGVVGTDFPVRHLNAFRTAGIDVQGLQQVPGETFKWSGVYENDMNSRRTLSTHLNVFASFSPELPEAYRRSPFLFLANIAPDLQLHVLEQMRKPKFVAADTMDLWIRTAGASLRKVIACVDLLLINDSEARQLTGEQNLLAAARAILKWGPRYVIVKKGEHGSMLVSRNALFLLPAYLVEAVKDPTGAGDSFAGGFLGCLAETGRVDEASVRKAMLYGSVVASFCVEAFSLDRLISIRRRDVDSRFRRYSSMLGL